MKRLLSTFYLFAIATACVMACSSESINEVNDTNDQKVPTAMEQRRGGMELR